MTAPTLTPLARFDVDLGAPVSVDAAPAQGRRFIPILGGTVSGRLNGVILPGGGDWQTIFADGRLELSAHYILQLGDAHVEVQSNGVRHGPPEVLARLARGEAVPSSEYYFRTAIRLRTDAPDLAWLNAIIALSVGERRGASVHLDIFQLG